ncbi:MAG: ATP-binding protein [Campylobacterota bacterium]|nr:ATP-binding protein [Campylobacterota bacterium]
MKTIDIDQLKDLLDETTQRLESTDNNIEINSIVESLIVSVMDSEFASFWIFDERTAILLRERSDSSVREISMLGQRGVLAKCFLTMSEGIYNYLASEKEYLPSTDNPDDIRMKSKIIVPLIDSERLIGIATACTSIERIKKFDQCDMDLFKAMVPFLINVAYSMHPKLKDDYEKVYLGKRLLEESSSVVERVEEFRQVKRSTEDIDDTLSLLSATVHDIRTPANTLYGFLELLEDQLDNPRLLQYINNAKESAQFINELTTSILDRVSSQRERKISEPVQINPTKFFADIAEIFSANMSDKKIAFNIYIDPMMPKEIRVEDTILKRVVMNLIGNAYKFTPSMRTIDFNVQYDRSKESLYISIEDEGIGITQEQQQSIFEAFTQAQDDTSVKYGGTGLGLSISSQYVKDLGGELKLKSELDAGSTFYFNIPVDVIDYIELFQPIESSYLELGILLNSQNIFSAKNITRYVRDMGICNDRITPVKKIANLPKNITHLICYQYQLNDDVIGLTEKKNIELLVVEEKFLSLIHSDADDNYTVISQHGYYADRLYDLISNRVQTKILIVDDDPINIQLLKAILEDEFCQVETAMDGEVALSKLKMAVEDEEPYTMVYLDKYMPKMMGTEVISTFRTFEEERGTTPIFAISVSGDTDGGDQERQHFDMNVGKPFNKKMIKETLHRVV